MYHDRSCRSCGAENRPVAKLCDQCGTPLTPPPETRPAPDDWASDLNRPGVLAGRLLSHAQSVTYRLSEHRLRPVGVSPAQFRALSLVRLLTPPVTPSVLALHLALDSRTVSDLVSRLEQWGWVQRLRDLPDRRAVRLELTAEGERILEAAWAPAMDVFDEVWSVLSPAELGPVLRALQRVRDASLQKLGYRPEDIFALGPFQPAEPRPAESPAVSPSPGEQGETTGAAS